MPVLAASRQPLAGLSKIAYLTFRYINFTRTLNIESMLPFKDSSMLNVGSLEVQCLSTAHGTIRKYCPSGLLTYQPSNLPKLFPHLQILSLTGVYPSDNKSSLWFPWDEQILYLPLNLSHFQFDPDISLKQKSNITASFLFERSLGITSNVGLNITNYCPFTKSLDNIIFIRTELKSIPFNCFTPRDRETSQLEILDLTNNRLGSFEDNTFKHLSNLQILHISDCRLTNLQVGLFDDLVNLRVLDVDYNNISYLQTGIFSKLVRLEKLYIHQNSIQHIEYQSLPTYSNNLVFVDLRWNDLRTLPYDCLTLPNLYLCDCKVNKISLNNLTDIISHFDPIRMQLVEPLTHYGESYSNNRVGIMHEVGQSSIDLGDNNITGIGYSHSWSP